MHMLVRGGWAFRQSYRHRHTLSCWSASRTAPDARQSHILHLKSSYAELFEHCIPKYNLRDISRSLSTDPGGAVQP